MSQAFALIRWELWQRRWSLMWWGVGVAALVSIDMLVYRSIKADAAQLNDVYNSLPTAVRNLFSDTGNLTSPIGYLTGRVYYLLLPVLLSIFSIGQGANLIGREEQQGTLELLLARPVSRTKLLLSKLAAGALGMLWLGIVALVIGLLCMVAFLFTALGRPARSAALGIASLFAFGGYIAASLESSVHWLRWPSKLLPYHYYQPSDILKGLPNQKWNLIGFLVALIVLAVGSWLGFRKRDIS
jgi:ABC-2 type transport system permease protein